MGLSIGPEPRTRRVRGAIALLAIAALLIGAGGAHAAVRLDTYKSADHSVGEVKETLVLATVPFHLDQPGDFYAKLLVTPWNPVNNGTPNGTVDANHAAGLTGWWISFNLADERGIPLAADANNETMNPALGTFVDSTSTRKVALAPETPYTLIAVIHVPAGAFLPADHAYRVPFALVFSEGDFTGGTSSGARLDQSRGFTAVIHVPGTGAVVDPGPVTVPDPGPDEGNPGPDGKGDEVVAPAPQVSPAVASTAFDVPVYLLWLLVILAVIAIALGVIAIAIASYVLVIVRRDVLHGRSVTIPVAPVRQEPLTAADIRAPMSATPPPEGSPEAARPATSE